MSKITNDRLNPVWHRMLYRCGKVGVKGLLCWCDDGVKCSEGFQIKLLTWWRGNNGRLSWAEWRSSVIVIAAAAAKYWWMSSDAERSSTPSQRHRRYCSELAVLPRASCLFLQLLCLNYVAVAASKSLSGCL